MKIKYVEGDLFDPILAYKKSGTILVPHVVNCKGAFGAGFVVPLARTFPVVRERYIEWADSKGYDIAHSKNPHFGLGQTQFVLAQEGTSVTAHTVVVQDGISLSAKQETIPFIYVCNMCAQTLGGPRPLFYNHLVACMEQVAEFSLKHESPRIVCPLFGSDLAGGSLEVILPLIQDIWTRKNIPVTIHYLKGKLTQSLQERFV